MSSYPSSIDSFVSPVGTNPLISPDHANLHAVAGSAITNIENKVGLGAGSPSANRILVGSGSGTSTWGTAWNQANLGSPSIIAGTITGQLVNNGTVGGGVFGTARFQGGTVADAAIGTPTLLGNGTIRMSGTVNPIQPGAAIAPSVGTASDSAGGTIAVNAQAQQIVEINLGTAAGNRTLGTPLNPKDGQFLGYRVKQNVNNTGTLVWGAVFRGTANAAALGTQSTWNYYGWRYNTTDTKWDFQGNATGLI